VAMGGLGLMVFAIHRMMRGRVLGGVLALMIASFFVAVIKPYVLFPFAVAGGVYVYAYRAARSGTPILFKPVYLVIGIFIAVTGVALLGWLFPRYAIDTLSDETTRVQQVSILVEGTSNFSYGD